jgi:hypothetical protein
MLSHPRIPLAAQIQPLRVFGLDRRNFFTAAPSFELLFTSNRFVDIVVRLLVKQAFYIVLFCESIKWLKLMLEDSAMQVSRETDVQSAGKAPENVHAIATPRGGHRGPSTALDHSLGE